MEVKSLEISRHVVYYTLIVFALVLFAVRLELFIHQNTEVLYRQCMFSNQTADVWNTVAATNIQQEEDSDDPPLIKQQKIKALQAFRFPHQEC